MLSDWDTGSLISSLFGTFKWAGAGRPEAGDDVTHHVVSMGRADLYMRNPAHGSRVYVHYERW